jgi:hypothetical protein
MRNGDADRAGNGNRQAATKDYAARECRVTGQRDLSMLLPRYHEAGAGRCAAACPNAALNGRVPDTCRHPSRNRSKCSRRGGLPAFCFHENERPFDQERYLPVRVLALCHASTSASLMRTAFLTLARNASPF